MGHFASYQVAENHAAFPIHTAVAVMRMNFINKGRHRHSRSRMTSLTKSRWISP